MTNITEKVNEGLAEILEMSEECIQNGDTFEETFPAFFQKRVEVDGKQYVLSVELNIKTVK